MSNPDWYNYETVELGHVSAYEPVQTAIAAIAAAQARAEQENLIGLEWHADAYEEGDAVGMDLIAYRRKSNEEFLADQLSMPLEGRYIEVVLGGVRRRVWAQA